MRFVPLLAVVTACAATVRGATEDAGAGATADAAPPVVDMHDVAADPGPDSPADVPPPITALSSDRRLTLLRDATMVLNPAKVRYGWGDRLWQCLGMQEPTPFRRVTRLELDERTYRYGFADDFACRAARNGGQGVQCWGNNMRASLGLGPPETVGGFVPAPGLTPVITQAETIVASIVNTCVSRSDGVWCWPVHHGAGSATPQVLPDRRRARRFCAFIPPTTSLTNSLMVCGFDCESSELECTGATPGGPTSDFVPSGRLDDVTALWLGERRMILAVRGDGTLLCQGDCGGEMAGTYGPEHGGFLPIRGLPPVRFAAGTSLSELGAACAILRDGTVTCWGRCLPWVGRECTLFNPRIYLPPALVPGLRDVVELSVSETHACALTSRDELWCWGDNRRHAVNPASNEEFYWSPVRVDVPAGP